MSRKKNNRDKNTPPKADDTTTKREKLKVSEDVETSEETQMDAIPEEVKEESSEPKGEDTINEPVTKNTDTTTTIETVTDVPEEVKEKEALEPKTKLNALVEYYVKGCEAKLPAVTCVAYQKGIIREILKGYPDNTLYTKDDLLSIVSENEKLQGPNAHSFELEWNDSDLVERKAYFTLLSFLNIQLADKNAKPNRSYVSANFTDGYIGIGEQLLKDFK